MKLLSVLFLGLFSSQVWAYSTPAELSSLNSHNFGSSIIVNSTVADASFTIIRATGSPESAFSTLTLSNTADFSLVSSTGCNRELVKTSDKCYPKVRFLKKGVIGSYSTTLTSGSPGQLYTITLSANVIAQPPPQPQDYSLELKESSVEIDTALDFGSQNKNVTITKTMTFSNVGTIAAPISVSLVGDSNFIMSNNSCTGTSLAKGSSCYFKITFSTGAGTAVDENKSSTLNLSSVKDPVSVSGLVRGTPVVVGSPSIKFYESSIEVSSLNYGSISAGSINKIFTVKNVGTAANNAAVVLSGDSAFAQGTNNCPVNLAVNASCQVRINLVHSSSNVGPKSATLSSGSFSLSLSGNLLSVNETYTANFVDPTNSLLACQGSLNTTKVMAACVRDSDQAIVDNQLCTQPAPAVTLLSPAGNKNVSISNGSEVRYCAQGSTSESFVSRSCIAEYFDNGSSCSSIIYVASYSAYVPSIPSNQVACDGTVTSNRSITLCIQQHDSQVVANNKCSDSTPTVVSQSPAGNKNVSISNGSETYSCLMGSSSQTFVSRACDSGYYNNGSSCALITYTASYSAYSPSIPSNLVACDGSVTSTRTITQCLRNDNSQVVSNSFCSDSTPSVVTQSPAGNKNVSISNGSETYSCLQGSSSQTFVSRSCIADYYDNGSSCAAIVYVPTFSAYSPAIPSNLVACDGTITSSRTITQCIQQHNSQVVANNKCSDSTPNVYTQSPAGNKNVSISNGSETYSCSQGSSTQTFVSRSCNSNFTDTGSVCQANFTYVSNGNSDYTTCAMNALGKLYCWGSNGWGALGVNSVTNSAVPVEPLYTGVLSGKTIKQVSNGLHNTCVIASDDLAYCVGSNLRGSLGNASTTQSNVYVAVSTAGVLAGKTIKKIAQGVQATCAIASDDRVYCWGRGTEGELGNGTLVDSNIPVAVNWAGVLAGKTVSEIQMTGQGSTSGTCVLASDNKVYCWGNNDVGQLCTGGGGNISNPTAVNTSGALSGKTVKSFHMSASKMYIVTTENRAYACGQNNVGQLGINSTTQASLPTEISMTNLSGKTVKSIHPGGSHGCLIASDDLPYCWGQNVGGRTGNGLTTGTTLLPTAVTMSGDIAGKTIKKMSISVGVSDNNTMVIASDDKVYTWGEGFYGALGNASTTTSAVPVAAVGTLATKTVTSISQSANTSCALTSQNQVFCWGQGVYNGTTGGNVSTPALLTFP